MNDFSVRAFRKDLRTLERQLELALAAQTACCGVTQAQCHVLLALEGSEGVSIGELALLLELDASTLSRTVDGLVKADYLDRREDPSNRRRQLVTLTVKGQERVDAINERCDRYYGDILDNMDEQDVANLVKAVPALAELMRQWRLANGAEGCCAKGDDIAPL